MTSGSRRRTLPAQGMHARGAAAPSRAQRATDWGGGALRPWCWTHAAGWSIVESPEGRGGKAREKAAGLGATQANAIRAALRGHLCLPWGISLVAPASEGLPTPLLNICDKTKKSQ